MGCTRLTAPESWTGFQRLNARARDFGGWASRNGGKNRDPIGARTLKIAVRGSDAAPLYQRFWKAGIGLECRRDIGAIPCAVAALQPCRRAKNKGVRIVRCDGKRVSKVA